MLHFRPVDSNVAERRARCPRVVVKIKVAPVESGARRRTRRLICLLLVLSPPMEKIVKVGRLVNSFVPFGRGVHRFNGGGFVDGGSDPVHGLGMDEARIRQGRRQIGDGAAGDSCSAGGRSIEREKDSRQGRLDQSDREEVRFDRAGELSCL
mmetsp:Transcript_52616/g.111747  ORF Transcript_52616/g.111747 Transcript_52616/m.111747 type:complete len:152 (-) Transcript_52616:445-900(-)